MKNIYFLQTKQKGFTLVELLIVVVMLALLTVVSGTAYIATMKTVRDGRRKVDLENIRSALEVYKSDNSTYPIVQGATTKGTTLGSFLDPTTGKKYLTMPTDPKNNLDYYYTEAGCTTFATGSTICNSYILATTLENTPKTPPSTACSDLKTPDLKAYACSDAAGAAAQCTYCLDPYGLVPVSAGADTEEMGL